MRIVARMTLGLVLIGAAFRVAAPLGAATALAGILVLSWWLPAAALARIEVRREHPARIFHGEIVEVTVTARNRGRLPLLWMSLSESVPFDLAAEEGVTRWVVGLGPGATKTFTYRIRGNRRGVYRLGPAVLTSGDVLGLRRVSGLEAAATGLTVYPRIVPVGGANLPARSPVPLLPARMPLYVDPTRVSGARAYRPGDSLRSIHWTATAAHGELLAKVLDPGIGRDTILCLDLDRSSYRGPGRRRRVEVAVTATASLAVHVATLQRLPVGLVTTSLDEAAGRRGVVNLQPSAAQGDLLSMLDALARVRLHPDADLPGLLDGTAARLPWGATLVVLTGSTHERLAKVLLGLRQRGFLSSVVEVGGEPGRDGWAAELRRNGIPVRAIGAVDEVAAL